MSLLGVLALPKNSTQKAGSKEKEAYDIECSIEAPSAEDGISSWKLAECSALGRVRAEVFWRINAKLQTVDAARLISGDFILCYERRIHR